MPAIVYDTGALLAAERLNPDSSSCTMS